MTAQTAPDPTGTEPAPKGKGAVGNVVGGFVAGLYSVPEGIGYAQLAGLNPMLGIYSGMVPVAVAAATTGSVLMMSTLTSAIALTTGGVLEGAGIASGQTAQAVFTLTLLVGLAMALLGVLKLGKVVNYVSNAVMTGFVMGVAILIMVGKFDNIFGYDPSGVTNKVVKAADILLHPGDWNLTTTAVGLGTIAAAFALKAIKPLERYALVLVVILGTALVWIFGIDTEVIADEATIPSGLSALPIPTSMADLPDLSLVPSLLVGAFSIALVALAQGAGIRPAFPNPDGREASASQDFLGQGLGNLAGSLFQSTPSGGSLSRTAVSADGGSTSRMAGFVAAGTVVLLVVLLAPVVGQIPEAVIGGLLFVIGVELVMGRMPDARLAMAAGRARGALFLITLIMTLTIPLQWAIIGGAILSLLAYIGSSGSGRPLQAYRQDDAGWLLEDDLPSRIPAGGVAAVAYSGPNFFAEVPTVVEELPKPDPAAAAPGVLVVDLGRLGAMSSTLLKALRKYHATLSEAGCGLVLSGVSPDAQTALTRSGILDELGTANVLPEDPHLGADLTTGLARGEALLRELTAAAGATRSSAP